MLHAEGGQHRAGHEAHEAEGSDDDARVQDDQDAPGDGGQGERDRRLDVEHNLAPEPGAAAREVQLHLTAGLLDERAAVVECDLCCNDRHWWLLCDG
jgi:hypothetical protein